MFGIKITPMFAWYGFWVGGFYDAKKKILYLFPLPCFGFKFEKIKKKCRMTNCKNVKTLE